MRKLLLASAAFLTASAITAPASAAVQINFYQGTAVSSLSGFEVINTFENLAGITSSNTVVQNVSNSSGAIIPLSDSVAGPGNSGRYMSVKGGGWAEIMLPGSGVAGFAIEWGSLDAYNKLIISTGVPGNDIVLIPGTSYLLGTGSNGNQFLPSTNGTLRVVGTAGEVFTKLRLQSTSNSFEVDNLAIKPVPEAGTWAMMFAGLGAVGFAVRRKKVTLSFA